MMLLVVSGLFSLFLAGCSAGGRQAEAQGPASTEPTSASDCAQATEQAACAPAIPATINPATPLPTSPSMPQVGPASATQTHLLTSPTPAWSSTSTPDPTSAPVSQATAPCALDLCIYPDRLVLARPVTPPGRDTIDISYRFGSTQGGQRDPHHGVEFLNSQGTPVLAAAAGEVVVAGDDRSTLYGPYSYFYGNLIILEHVFPDLPQPFYTLYAHLSKISVEAGDRVEAGQPIGEVGMTGVATGSHLHFEVRLGENDYHSSRNPEVWLAPRIGPDGQPLGALAGRILDSLGNSLQVENIVIEHLTARDGPADASLYLQTYEEKALTGQPPYAESFAAGDLPDGWYRISFVQGGMQSHMVEVLPGQLTVVTLRIGND